MKSKAKKFIHLCKKDDFEQKRKYLNKFKNDFWIV